MVDEIIDGGVARIFLNRPEKANALDSALLAELQGALERLGKAHEPRAALLPRLIGSGRAAWLVLTGQPIDARRAHDWGLVEELGGDEALEILVASLVNCDREALAMQKQLLQLWEEAPLAQSIQKSIELFARARR